MMNKYVEGLIVAGKKYEGAHICESEINQFMMDKAQTHAEYEAVHGQGHQGFSDRVAALQLQVGPYQYAEICAESWPEQKDATPEELGYEAFKCWEQSKGHWSVCITKHKYVGYGVAQGNNGIWYFCAIVGD